MTHREADIAASSLSSPPGSLGESLPDSDVKAIANRLLRFHAGLNGALDFDQFGDPAFLMLLELLVAEVENRRLALTKLCLATGTPATTGLRLLDRMEKKGQIRRHSNPADRRSAYATLMPETSAALRAYLAKHF
jgi:DNA-binding MarR family transcriptional regulator